MKQKIHEKNYFVSFVFKNILVIIKLDKNKLKTELYLIY